MIETRTPQYALSGWSNLSRESFISKVLSHDDIDSIQPKDYSKHLHKHIKFQCNESIVVAIQNACKRSKLCSDDFDILADRFGVLPQSLCIIDTLELEANQTHLAIHHLPNTDFNKFTKKLRSSEEIEVNVKAMSIHNPSLVNITEALHSYNQNEKAYQRKFRSYLNSFVVIIDIASSTVFYRIDDLYLNQLYSGLELLKEPIPFSATMLTIAIVDYLQTNNLKLENPNIKNFPSIRVCNHKKLGMLIGTTNYIKNSERSYCPYFSFTGLCLVSYTYGTNSNKLMFTVDLNALHDYFFNNNAKVKDKIIIHFAEGNLNGENLQFRFQQAFAHKLQKNAISRTSDNANLKAANSYNETPLPLIECPQLQTHKQVLSAYFNSSTKNLRALNNPFFIKGPQIAKVHKINSVIPPEPPTIDEQSFINEMVAKSDPIFDGVSRYKINKCIHHEKFAKRNYVPNMVLSETKPSDGILQILMYVAEAKGILVHDKSNQLEQSHRERFNKSFSSTINSESIDDLTSHLSLFLKTDFDQIIFLTHSEKYVYFHSSFNSSLVAFYKSNNLRYVNEGKIWRFQFDYTDQASMENLFKLIHEILERKIADYVLDTTGNCFIKLKDGQIFYAH